MEGSGRLNLSYFMCLEGSGRLNVSYFTCLEAQNDDKFITFAWFWDGRFWKAKCVVFDVSGRLWEAQFVVFHVCWKVLKAQSVVFDVCWKALAGLICRILHVWIHKMSINSSHLLGVGM